MASVMADPPEGHGLSSWRDSKSQLVSAIRPLTAEETVRGQYDGYLDVDGVAAGSTTESYVAVRLSVDTVKPEVAQAALAAGATLLNDISASLWEVAAATGAGWALQQEDLVFGEQPASDMRTYDRLIGAALAGQHWLFARQDTVEAAWRVVDPVLGNVVPLHIYPKGSWGPKEADGLLPDRVPWHDPA